MRHFLLEYLTFAPGDPGLPLHPRHVGRQPRGQITGERGPPPEPQSAQTEIPVSQGRAQSDLITLQQI